MKIIGHRGARGLAPENTLASLQKALDHHVDEIEFDVHVTKDEVVVLHHDYAVTDPDGTTYMVIDHSYIELKKHKKDLATLEEALKEFGGKIPLYIEVKPKVKTRPIINIIKNYDGQATSFALASKSQKTLMELHRALPEIEKIVIEPWSGVRAHFRVRQVNAKRVSMNQKWLWSGFIRSVSRSGHQLIAYTVNDPAKAKRWAKHGLAGVVTDCPDRFEK